MDCMNLDKILEVIGRNSIKMYDGEAIVHPLSLARELYDELSKTEKTASATAIDIEAEILKRFRKPVKKDFRKKRVEYYSTGKITEIIFPDSVNDTMVRAVGTVLNKNKFYKKSTRRPYAYDYYPVWAVVEKPYIDLKRPAAAAGSVCPDDFKKAFEATDTPLIEAFKKWYGPNVDPVLSHSQKISLGLKGSEWRVSLTISFPQGCSIDLKFY